ncbi:MAG: hypothetical protein GX589_04660 [Deltaproteobacteria bacterium]|nr:hypothetical protein [Deltaproteobacteria bacterium]
MLYAKLTEVSVSEPILTKPVPKKSSSSNHLRLVSTSTAKPSVKVFAPRKWLVLSTCAGLALLAVGAFFQSGYWNRAEDLRSFIIPQSSSVRATADANQAFVQELLAARAKDRRRALMQEAKTFANIQVK